MTNVEQRDFIGRHESAIFDLLTIAAEQEGVLEPGQQIRVTVEIVNVPLVAMTADTTLDLPWDTVVTKADLTRVYQARGVNSHLTSAMYNALARKFGPTYGSSERAPLRKIVAFGKKELVRHTSGLGAVGLTLLVEVLKEKGVEMPD